MNFEWHDDWLEESYHYGCTEAGVFASAEPNRIRQPAESNRTKSNRPNQIYLILLLFFLEMNSEHWNNFAGDN